MKRVLATTCFAVAAAVALAAQPPASQEQPKQKPATGQDKTVSVTGCLRAGDTPDTFVLANVKPDTAKGETATGTTGTGTAAIPADSTLRITGAPASLNLKAHVGHTVALTGMIVPQGRSTGASGTTGAKPTDPAKPSDPAARPSETSRSATDQQTFNVKTMKHVSETCTQ